MDLVLIIIVGAITTWLSIGSLHKDRKLENANNQLISKQDSIIKLQQNHKAELQKKSDEIIRLEEILREKSDSNATNIYKLQNPIPENIAISFSSSLDLSPNEFNDIKAIVKLENSKNGNLFPFDSKYTNDGFEKINSFKNLHFRLIFTFHNKGKIMAVAFNRPHLNFWGYHTQVSGNSCNLYINDKESIMMFDGSLLEAESISTNYESPSIIDFVNSKVLIYYDFAFPKTMKYGSLPTDWYIADNRYSLILNFKSFSLSNKKLSINITKLKRVDNHNFEGYWLSGKQ